jgi:hypothetical protein
MTAPRILYCHCAYAKVVPVETKTGVLDGLSAANVEFDAVPDLCEMAARHDERLQQLTTAQPLHIAACYPRAVQWLFASAGAPLSNGQAHIWNMRTESAESVLSGLLDRQPESGPSPVEPHS